MKKLTTEEFVEKIKKIHSDKYDYSSINYMGQKIKIKIICPEHGVLEVLPYNISSGQGCCKYCGKDKVKLNTEIFIEKSKQIHGDKYDYSLVNYINAYTKVKIICPEHGVFEQKPNSHLSNKRGCQKCYGNQRKTTEKYIEDVKKVHGDKYDYSLVDYKNSYTKVKIICSEHGVFEQKALNHLQGQICRYCDRGESEFIKKANKIHNNKYDYSLIEYIDAHNKVKIICPEHGVFEQKPGNHINAKQGCPVCNESKGEKFIREYLEKNGIRYILQKRFVDCKNKKPLPFDFYLLDYNLCIEYDGIQHYENILNRDLEYIKINDDIKNQYCEVNNIKLVRIKYTDDINEQLYKLHSHN